MDDKLLQIQNSWWMDATAIDKDQHLLAIKDRSYQFTPAIINDIDPSAVGIYIIRGPRQVGKTTTIKILIRSLIRGGIDPRSIIYISCETIESFGELESVLVNCLKDRPEHMHLFLDEVSFVPSWQRAILGLSNLGFLNKATVVLTGSNARDLKESGERLPGRRGAGRDLELYPLSISEMKALACFRDKGPEELLGIYMCVGGFPRAVSDFVQYGSVLDSTYDTYRNWIVGDAQRYELRQETLKQILYRIAETLSSRITWPVLIENSPVKSHETALQYVEHLQDAFLCSINHCYDEKKHGPSFQKARKLYFIDPLLYSIAMTWRDGIPNIFEAMKKKIEDPEFRGKLFESVVLNHFFRTYDSVYFWYSAKQNKEVDALIAAAGSMRLFEVKSRPCDSFTALGQNVSIIYPEEFMKSV